MSGVSSTRGSGSFDADSERARTRSDDAIAKHGSIEPWQIWLTVILVVGAAIRIWGLSDRRLWWDEGTSAYLAGLDWHSLTIGKDLAIDPHPPVYHVLLRVWTLLFGRGEVAVRSLSLVLGTLTIIPAYHTGRWLRDRRTGMAAALLMALWPIHVLLSREARMYTLTPLLALLLVQLTGWLLPADLGLEPRRGRGRETLGWTAYTLLVAVAAHSYYYLSFLVVAVALWAALKAWQARRLPWRWLAATGVAVALCIPWAGIVLTRVGPEGAAAAVGGPAVPLRQSLRAIWLALSIAGQGPSVGLLLSSLPVALGVISGAGLAIRCGKDSLKKDRVQFLAASLVIALALNLVFTWLRPLRRDPRHFVYLLPLMVMLIAYAVARVRRLALAATLLLLLLVPGWAVVLSGRQLSVPDVSGQVEMIHSVSRLAREDDVLLVGYSWQAGFVDTYVGSELNYFLIPSTWGNPLQVRRDLEKLGRRYRRAWMLQYDERGRYDLLPEAGLSCVYTRRAYVDECGGSRLILYTRGPGEALDLMPGQAEFRFAEGITILGFDIQSASASTCTAPSGAAHRDEFVPGQTIHLKLALSGLPIVGRAYSLFVHLADVASGRPYAQDDHPPLRWPIEMAAWQVGEVVIDHSFLGIPPDLPAGAYELKVGFYDVATGQRLALLEPAGHDDSAVLCTFEVQ